MFDCTAKIKITGIFLIAAIVSNSFATVIPLINIGWNGDSWESSFSESDINSDIPGHFNVAKHLQNASINTDTELQFSTDAFVLINLTVMNVSDVVQTYSFSFSVPLDPVYTNSTFYGGSTAGSVTDNGASPFAIAACAGEKAFYEGKIDGSTVLSIYDTSTSWGVLWGGGTTNINAVNVGLPGPFMPGPAAINSIGIDHSFTLTPGDVIAVTSYFQVTPEPASISILGFGWLVLARIVKRS